MGPTSDRLDPPKSNLPRCGNRFRTGRAPTGGDVPQRDIGVVAWNGVGLDRPFPRVLQAILMLRGMPRAVKRLMQRPATAASAF